MKMLWMVAALGLLGLAPAASAAVNVERHGSENPVQEIAKSTLYGALAGGVLGGAILLANNGDNAQEIMRWSVAGGTFFGFAYGFYFVSRRPSAALLEIDQGKLQLGGVAPSVGPAGDVRVTLLATRF